MGLNILATRQDCAVVELKGSDFTLYVKEYLQAENYAYIVKYMYKVLCRSSILHWTFLPPINTDFNKDQNHFHFIFIRVKTPTSAHSILEATDFWQNLLWIFLSV